MIVSVTTSTFAKSITVHGAVVALAAGALVALPGTSLAAGPLPCDIYGTAGTPCVARTARHVRCSRRTRARSTRSACFKQRHAHVGLLAARLR